MNGINALIEQAKAFDLTETGGSMIDIRVSDVVTTGGTQSRVALSEEAVANYAEAIEGGALLPPIVVFHDGSSYWLADGFHRLMAFNRLGVEWVPAEAKQGTRRDAVLYSVGSNADHGLPRTNADKRHAVSLLLGDEEWATWSNVEIARRCAVHRTFVDKIRRESSHATNACEPPTTRTYTTKHGTIATMQTENIGRKHGYAGAKSEKTDAIRELAAEGMRSSQIASKVGLDEKTVRLYASQAQIDLPDKAIGKRRKIDARRVIEQTVASLEASAQSLNTIPIDFSSITKAEAAEWCESVAESLSIFRRFHNSLKGVSNE